MSRTFWIVLIIIAGIALLLLLLAAVPRIKDSLRNLNGWVYILLIILAAGILAFAAFKIFGPKGSDSITSENVEGIEKGDAEVDTDLDKKGKRDGTSFTDEEATEGNEVGDTTVYVTVRGDEIIVGLTPFDDAEQFSRAMQSLSLDGREVCLIDNYATAKTYHQVAEGLKELKIHFSETTDDEIPIVAQMEVTK